ncbi:MAG: hypothetical protein WD739_07340 [Actinomycetota bacterium]
MKRPTLHTIGDRGPEAVIPLDGELIPAALLLAEAESDDDLEEADSLDEQAREIRDAWREHSKSSLGNDYTWADEVYEDHVIVKKGKDYWSVPFSRSGSDITFDQDAAKKVEREWVDVSEAVVGDIWVNPIAEAEGEEPTGSEWDVAIIKAGASKNGKYYPAKMLAESVALFEGKPVLARSDDDHLKQRNKSVEKIVGWVDGIHFKNNAVRGRLHLSESAGGLRTLLIDAWKRGKKDLVGLSIVGAAKSMRPTTKNGRRLALVEGIRKVSSVDIVVDPSAGGEILDLVAADDGKEESVGLKALIEAIRKARPELVKELLAEASTEDVDELKKEAPDLSDKIAEAMALPEPKKDDPAKTEPKKDELVEADKDDKDEPELLSGTIARLTIREALEDTKLPDPVKTRIRKRFEAAPFAEQTLAEAVKDEIDAWADLEKNELVTRSEGSPRVTVGLEEAQKAKAALDGLFLNEAVELDGEKIRPYRSIRQAYIELTGDGANGHLTGRLPSEPTGKLGLTEANGGRAKLKLHEWDPDGELVLAEAITTATFDQILADSVTRQMVADYRRRDRVAELEPLVDKVPLSDVRTQRRVRYGGYGNLPTVAAGDPYGALSSPTDEEATYTPAKRGGTETINLEAIINDDLGAIRDVPRRLARAGSQTLHEFVLDFLRTNPNIYDGTALFVGGHNNLGSLALSTTSLAAARRRMRIQTEKDSSKRLGLVPKHLWVPTDLEELAYVLTQSDKKQGTADNDANFVKAMGLVPHVVDYWTDANNWFVNAEKGEVPLIELGFYGPEDPEIFTQDMPNVGSMFSNDQLTYKIRHWYGAAVVDFRGFDGSVVA